MLRVKNLKKQFQDNIIWTDLSANFKAGEIVCIQGKSGEGKTTFLRCINNLETVDGGSIDIGDFNLCRDLNGKVQYAEAEELKKLSSYIGLVFQNFNLFPNLSVEENLKLAPEFKKMNQAFIDSRCRDLLDDMGLLDKKDLYPYQLSGGQQQRVAIARACMLSPNVLCFDEPTSALDESTRDQVGDIIRGLAKTGMTQIIVTHDNDFARSISDRILHIVNGRFAENIE